MITGLDSFRARRSVGVVSSAGSGAGTAADLGDPAPALRSAGLRVTRQRTAVLRALRGAPHADADTIALQVRAELGTVSVQAVYDILHALCRAGLIRAIEPAGGPARYELEAGDNHHHVVCRNCGSAADVACALGAAPCLTPSESHGFLVDEAEVTFWGLCPDCREDLP
jgi:Fur family ferric uptake transcriptional regulator